MGDWSNGDNLLRINLADARHFSHRSDPSVWEVTYMWVGPEVVSLDVVKVRRVLERRVLPIQFFHPPITMSEWTYSHNTR